MGSLYARSKAEADLAMLASLYATERAFEEELGRKADCLRCTRLNGLLSVRDDRSAVCGRLSGSATLGRRKRPRLNWSPDCAEKEPLDDALL